MWTFFFVFWAGAFLLLLSRRLDAHHVIRTVGGGRLTAGGFDTVSGASAHGAIDGAQVELGLSLLGSIWIEQSGLSRRFRIPRLFKAETAIQIGDPRFEDVLGDPLSALSALTADARSRFEALASADVHLVHGRLVCTHDAVLANAAEIEPVLRSMLDLSRSLAAQPLGPAALLANALGDPLPGVREQNAMFLATHFPESPESAALFAAALAGGPFKPHWQVIAPLLTPSVRAEYLQAAERTTIAEMLRATRAPLLDRLLAALAGSGKPGEGALVAVVERAPDDETSKRALGFLGGTATTAAIEPLRAVRTFLSGGAFDRAIELIKARAEGADPGQLTLADPAAEGGALSVAVQAGALSNPAGNGRREP